MSARQRFNSRFVYLVNLVNFVCLVCLAWLICPAGPASAFAQADAGGASIEGVVRDASGAAITQARLSITSEEGGWSRDVTPTGAGLYAFLRLPPGSYALTVMSDGFQPFARTGIQLTVGMRAVVDVTLSPAGMTETLTVSAPSTLVDAARTHVGTVVNERAVRNLPINGRNFLDFAQLTPGVVRDPRIGDLAIAGQRGPANSLLVDGGDANSAFWGQSVGRAGFRNPYAFSMDAVQEFQVNSSSYAPELGRATGGVINVITKSGTNDFRGTAFWFFRDRAMNANTFFNNRAGIDKPPYRYNQFGGNLGGPLQRSRLFFFYNYDAQRNTAPNSVFFPVAPPTDAPSQAAVAELTPLMETYDTGLHNDIHTAKVDFIGSANHTLSGRYNRHRFVGRNWEAPGAQSALDRTGDATMNTDSVSIAHTWLVRNLVLDQRVSFLYEDNPSSANADGPEVIVRQGGVTMLAFGSVNHLPRYTTQRKTGVIQTLAWSIGRHTVKAGHDFKFERTENLAPTLFRGQYTFNSLSDFALRRPVSFAQALAGADTDGPLTFPSSDSYAVFAQDSWRASDRVTIDYGVRYDLFSYDGNDVRNPDPGLAALGYATGVVPRDTNDVAARLGVVYRLRRDGDLVVRGGAGTFYGSLPGLVARTIQAQNGIQIKTFTLTGAAMPAYPSVLTESPALGGAVPDIYVADPDFRTPKTDQWSVGIDGVARRTVRFSATYLGSRGADLTRIRDINLFPAETVAARMSDGAPIAFQRHPGVSSPLRPNTSFGRVSAIESSASSSYHAGVLQSTIRVGDRVQLDASFTMARAIDTAPDATPFIPNSASEDPKLVQDTLDPDADRGLSEAHVGRRFVLGAIWDLDGAAATGSSSSGGSIGGGRGWRGSLFGGWQIAGIVSIESGRPYSARTSVDLNNDGNRFSDRAPAFGRNTLALPAFASVDLRASKSIALAGTRQIRLIVEGFNVLNRANVSTIQQVAYTYDAATRTFTPNPTFSAATNTSDPRILQVAARFTF